MIAYSATPPIRHLTDVCKSLGIESRLPENPLEKDRRDCMERVFDHLNTCHGNSILPWNYLKEHLWNMGVQIHDFEAWKNGSHS